MVLGFLPVFNASQSGKFSEVIADGSQPDSALHVDSEVRTPSLIDTDLLCAEEVAVHELLIGRAHVLVLCQDAIRI